jgi:hypothetical protein
MLSRWVISGWMVTLRECFTNSLDNDCGADAACAGVDS